jgi:hypothetical protein
MDRLPPARAATRTLAQHRDARGLRAVVVDALAAAPIDEQAFRDGVWTHVRGERQNGVAPGLVILALTDMVERARIVPDSARITRTRDVILWCVEAYFGQLGGTDIGSGRAASVDGSADELEQETPRASP